MFIFLPPLFYRQKGIGSTHGSTPKPKCGQLYLLYAINTRQSLEPKIIVKID